MGAVSAVNRRPRLFGGLTVGLLLCAPLLAASASGPSSTADAPHCLDTGNGFLRARLRGALDLDLDWHDRDMQCDGELRPDGHGIRVAVSGPRQRDGRRLRFVFGIADAAEGRAGRDLPTNLTVIFENEERLFSTLGDARCTTDALDQERIGAGDPAPGGAVRVWRVIARGFCTAPATAPGDGAHLLIERFDFAGLIRVGTDGP